MTLTEQHMLEQILLALVEEAEDLKSGEGKLGSRPDRADLMIAAAFERLADNIRTRLECQ